MRHNAMLSESEFCPNAKGCREWSIHCPCLPECACGCNSKSQFDANAERLIKQAREWLEKFGLGEGHEELSTLAEVHLGGLIDDVQIARRVLEEATAHQKFCAHCCDCLEMQGILEP